MVVPDASGTRTVTIRPYTKKRGSGDPEPDPGTTPKLFVGGLVNRVDIEEMKVHTDREEKSCDDCSAIFFSFSFPFFCVEYRSATE